MQLLLFLSAILTALTGAITGTRVSEPQQLAASSIASIIETTTVAVARAMPETAMRPAAELAKTAFAFFVAAPAPRQHPLYAERRRQ